MINEYIKFELFFQTFYFVIIFIHENIFFFKLFLIILQQEAEENFLGKLPLFEKKNRNSFIQNQIYHHKLKII